MPRISIIVISTKMKAKIGSLHGVTEDEVNWACTIGYRDSRWDDHPERGRRLLVKGVTEHGRALFVCLFPTELDYQWNLGTAYES